MTINRRMEEILGTELDKLGNEVKVHFCLHENMPSKLTSFFARQWAELLESGYVTSNYIPNITSCRVIYITSKDEIVGLRLWTWSNNTTNIILTSVDPKFRRKGLFEIISRYYDQRLIKGDCVKSITFIHIDNIAMIEAAKKAGYDIEFVKMIKKYNCDIL